MDPIIREAARAYGIPLSLLVTALELTPDPTFSDAELKRWRFRGDPTMREHQVYLTARRLSEVRPLHDDQLDWIRAYHPEATRRVLWKNHPNRVLRLLGRIFS